jgi:hypothetical protein
MSTVSAIANWCSFERNQQESRLLGLPAEIRNKIFGYVFDDNHEIWVTRDYNEPMCIKFYTWGSAWDLLTVCRSVYMDTRLLSFASAVVVFNYCGYHDYWRVWGENSILPIQREALSTISVAKIDLETTHMHDFFKDCKVFLPGLKCVFMDMRDACECETGECDECEPFVRESFAIAKKVLGKNMQVVYGRWPYPLGRVVTEDT